MGDAGERSHGAWKDDHAGSGVAAARDVGAYVVLRKLFGLRGRVAKQLLRELVPPAQVEFFRQDPKRALRGDQVDL